MITFHGIVQDRTRFVRQVAEHQRAFANIHRSMAVIGWNNQRLPSCTVARITSSSATRPGFTSKSGDFCRMDRYVILKIIFVKQFFVLRVCNPAVYVIKWLPRRKPRLIRQKTRHFFSLFSATSPFVLFYQAKLHLPQSLRQCSCAIK